MSSTSLNRAQPHPLHPGWTRTAAHALACVFALGTPVSTSLACRSTERQSLATDPPSSGPIPADAGSLDPRGFDWHLVATHTTLAMGDREQFGLSIGVTNRGKRTADPQLNGCVDDGTPCLPSGFTMNGETALDLDLAFGNGRRENRWSALPPGETVTDHRKMGTQLFPKPGVYRIGYRHGPAATQVTVTVTP